MMAALSSVGAAVSDQLAGNLEIMTLAIFSGQCQRLL
jgi:hypothetical protein